MKALSLFLIAALGLLAASCKVGPNYATPNSNVAPNWQQSPAITNRPYAAAEEYWWKNFNDADLDRLIETAFRNDLSLQTAGVRILQARAQLNKSIGNLFPQQQTLSGAINYERLHDGAISSIPGIDPNYLSDQLLFAATWEIDFWGKYRRQIESERASYFGTIAAYDDALVTLIGDVANSYVNIRTLEERLRVAQRNLELQRESLRIAEAQFKAGETSERDVQQALTQTAQTESEIPHFEQALMQDKDGLAVLLGLTPGEIGQYLEGTNHIPVPPSTVAAGIPKDLLRRRPDVRAAGLQAASMSALIGVAKAHMYPASRWRASSGLRAITSSIIHWRTCSTGEGRALQAGAGFVFPIFNYGRLVNQVRVQDAQFQTAVLQLPEYRAQRAARGGGRLGGVCEGATNGGGAAACGKVRPPLHPVGDHPIQGWPDRLHHRGQRRAEPTGG